MDATQIRAELDHPVIDADGHIIEFLPLLRDLVADEAGGAVADRFDALAGSAAVRRSLDDETKRAHALAGRVGGPAQPQHARPGHRDAARAPVRTTRRARDRLRASSTPRWGSPSWRSTTRSSGAPWPGPATGTTPTPTAPRRPAATRRGDPDLHPEEAIAELEYAAGELGLKGFLFGGLVCDRSWSRDRRPRRVLGRRPRPRQRLRLRPALAPLRRAGRLPHLPLHRDGFGSRTSPTSYVANHIGNFAAGGEAVCRSLFFGGAMSRFPELRVGLPGGRRGLGLQPAGRHGRALREAES